MGELILESSQNPKVKFAKRLWEKRERDESQSFLIEGFRELSRAMGSPFVIETLFFTPELFLGIQENLLLAEMRKKGAHLFRLTEKLFRSLSYRDRPDGLLAIAKQSHLSLRDLKIKPCPFFLIAEAIEKPGNLGTILRSADAVGADGVIVADRCTDIFNPNVVRSSVGTLFTLPVVEASTPEILQWCHEHHIALVATMPAAEKIYTEVDLRQALAICVGTEQLGLSQPWKEAATVQVKIPMRGVADSLNVASATTLLLYEVLRQRT